jgi:Asp-tRNA(Asn)/Glu-tRNA(Gln) amidotransferase A subunit family amidase
VRQFDVLLTPVVAGPAPLHGTPPAGYPVEEYFQCGAFNYTHTFSVAGLPAMAVPVAREGGLPVGVQVVSSAWQEHIVLAASAVLEAAASPAAAEQR